LIKETAKIGTLLEKHQEEVLPGRKGVLKEGRSQRKKAVE